jgi:hypothetical protein
MDFTLVKNGINEIESMAQQICERIFGSCSIESVDVTDSNKIEVDVLIHTLQSRIVFFVKQEVFEQSNIDRATLLFQLTDNIQQAVTFNGILKGDILLIGVVSDKSIKNSDFPQCLKSMLGIKRIAVIEESISIEFNTKVPMIVGTMLTPQGKQDQFNQIEIINGKLIRQIKGDKSFFYIEVTSVE